MNEITFTGNVSKIHGTRHTQAGDVIFSDLAHNREQLAAAG